MEEYGPEHDSSEVDVPSENKDFIYNHSSQQNKMLLPHYVDDQLVNVDDVDQSYSASSEAEQ